MKKLLIALVFLGSIFPASCSDSSNPVSQGFSTSDLTAGYTKVWKLSAYFINGTRIEIPLYVLDNVVIFNQNGTGSFWFGEIRKDLNDSIKVDDISWTLNGSSFRIENLHLMHDPDGDSIRNSTILELSSSVLRYNYVNHLNQTVEAWYQPYCYPNPYPSAKNIFLTHGYSKIWKIDSVWVDGSVYNIPEWGKDDYFLFNSDGTGIYTTGVYHQYPNDTLLNDIFHWVFVQNDTKIDIENFENGHIVVSDCDIINLSNDLFIYEGWLFWEGQLRHWRIKRVPLF